MGEAAHLNSLILQEYLLCNNQPGQSVLPVSRCLGIPVMSARETLKIRNDLQHK